MSSPRLQKNDVFDKLISSNEITHDVSLFAERTETSTSSRQRDRANVGQQSNDDSHVTANVADIAPELEYVEVPEEDYTPILTNCDCFNDM